MSYQVTNILSTALELSSLSTVDLLKTFISGMNMTEESTKNKLVDDDILLNNLERQTKIIRELAISRRIDTAEKVSIEEFYDTRGDGKAGVQASDASLNIGISGSGERVTKRVYTFEGWRDGGLKGVDEEILKLLKDKAGDLMKEKITIEE